MIVCPQIEITDAKILSSSIAEDDAPVHDPDATYALADLVMVGHSVYESLQGGNVGHTPGDRKDPGWWLRIGSTNKFKPFEYQFEHIKIVSDACEAPSPVTYSVQPGELVSVVGFFGMEGVETITLSQADPVEGTVFSETIDLADSSEVVDPWSFFFGPFEYDTEHVAFDVRPYPGSTFQITLTGNGNLRIGQIVFSDAKNLGVTVFGTELGTRSYDEFTQNEFGDFVNVQDRGHARTVDFDIRYETQAGRRIQRFLDGNRRRGAIYLAGDQTERFGTTVFGYYRNFQLNTAGPSISNGTIEVETFK